MRKNYVIMVGRSAHNGAVYNVRCTENEIETVAMAHYYYANDNRLYGDLPICCVYAEGEEFGVYNPNNVVLIDCM